jgi:hypothetical protein
MAFQRRLTTKALIEEVRSLSDDSNTADVTDEEILSSLNRAQDRVASVLARHYNPPLLQSRAVALTPGVTEYAIPEDAFEGRLLKVEFSPRAGSFQRLEPIGISDIDKYEFANSTAIPYYYCEINSMFRLVPGNPGFGSLRIWFCEDPAPLVVEQGRLTVINVPGNYIIVDELGTDVSTASDDLESYVNLVDKNSGRIKATLQVQAISDRKVTFRTVPTRSTVQDRAVVGALPATVELDDYLCPVAGTCVPFMKKPAANYLIQYAAADIAVTKLGGDPGILMGQVTKMEEDVQRSWSGRPNTIRVRQRGASWQSRRGRFY